MRRDEQQQTDADGQRPGDTEHEDFRVVRERIRLTGAGGGGFAGVDVIEKFRARDQAEADDDDRDAQRDGRFQVVPSDRYDARGPAARMSGERCTVKYSPTMTIVA